MKNNLLSFKILMLLVLIFSVGNELKAQEAFGPVPSKNQMKWQEMEYYGFVHLSVNTYTDMAWGFGNEDPKIFNPTDLDCRQWARIAKESGMKGIILTAKHHSGFCLWPSKYTEYSVKNAPWKNGKGDIVREMSDACKEYGLKLGIYLSPWDRNHPDYGKPEYITYFRNQLKELLTNYGDVFEVWFDGANGGDGYYGGANETRRINRDTYYDWANTYKLVRELQPEIVIWNDNGDRADLRWVGTEAGYVGKTNWSLLNATGKVTEDMLRHGVENGDAWVPGEVNTSIRPEWFYHKREDSKVKTLPDLMTIYYNSIGRNGTLLLNFPIMPNGLIHQKDEKAVLDFAEEVKKVFAVNLAKKAKVEASNTLENKTNLAADKTIDDDTETYWAMDDQSKSASASLVISFDKTTTFNRFLVQEYIKLGQRVKSFKLEANVNGSWKELATETTIGYKRILCFPTVETSKLRFTILDTKKGALISNIGIYNAPQILTAPQIIRKQSGAVAIIPSDSESEIYYTLDGSTPNSKSKKYTNEVVTSDSKIEVKAIAYNPVTAKSSAVAEENFDISRKNWKILNNDSEAYKSIDGEANSVWHLNEKLPAEVIIDFGKIQNLVGFRYLPDQDLRSKGIVTKYQFYVSLDNKKWDLVNEGEFSNITNNPLWQNKSFKLAKIRYVKFKALENTKGDNVAGFAEIDVITK